MNDIDTLKLLIRRYWLGAETFFLNQSNACFLTAPYPLYIAVIPLHAASLTETPVIRSRKIRLKDGIRQNNAMN